MLPRQLCNFYSPGASGGPEAPLQSPALEIAFRLRWQGHFGTQKLADTMRYLNRGVIFEYPIAGPFSALLLSGCGSTNYEQPIQEQPYDQAISARIRLFGNNGLLVAINPGQDCASSKEPLYAYGYTVAD